MAPRASPRLAEIAHLQGPATIADVDNDDADDTCPSEASQDTESDDSDANAGPPPARQVQSNARAPVRAQTAKKARGRPKKKSEPFIWDEDMEEESMPCFSLTYGKKGDHMPPIWFTCMSEFLEEKSPRFINSRERGFKNEHLHGQSTGYLPIAADKATIEKAKKQMKSAMGVTHGDGSGCQIDLKVLVTGQTFIRMVGYCLKDEGLPHFLTVSKGVSDEEKARGIAEHMALKLNYMDGLIAVNKTNLFQRAHTFWSNYMADQSDVGFTFAKSWPR